MATKTIDVTLAVMRNPGTVGVSPKGVINARTVRAVEDEQIFQSETLYQRPDFGQPMHPSGATHIPPGQSLTYNVTKRLKVSHFAQETPGHLNQMLIFNRDLTDRVVVLGQIHEVVYQGNFNRKVRFDEIDGFSTVSCDYSAFHGDVALKVVATYTVNLVSSSG